MRGLAAIAIVVYHLWLIQISVLGAAVDLFFVLSGYLITSILLSHPPSERFLLAFYCAARAANLADLLPFLVLPGRRQSVDSVPGSLEGLPYFLTFSQGLPYYWQDDPPAFITAFRHTWSLAIEEQFYVVWPAALWLLGKKRLPWAAAALVGLAVSTRSIEYEFLDPRNALRRSGTWGAYWRAGCMHHRTRRPGTGIAMWLFRLGSASAAYWAWAASSQKRSLCVVSRSRALSGYPEHPSAQPEYGLFRAGRPDRLLRGPSQIAGIAGPATGLLRTDQLRLILIPSHCFQSSGTNMRRVIGLVITSASI